MGTVVGLLVVMALVSSGLTAFSGVGKQTSTVTSTYLSTFTSTSISTLVSPTIILSTITQTNTISTTIIQISTTTSTISVPQPPPLLVTLQGRVNVTLGNYVTKIIFQNQTGGQVSYSVTNGQYMVNLANMQTWQIHVYWNSTPTGGGDKVCAVIYLKIQEPTGPIGLDLSC